MADTPFDIVLFDLGGVLIELRGVEPMRLLSGITNDDELWERWLTCPWVRAFERGDCDAMAFAEGIIGDWGLTAEPEAFLDAFRELAGRADARCAGVGRRRSGADAGRVPEQYERTPHRRTLLALGRSFTPSTIGCCPTNSAC